MVSIYRSDEHFSVSLSLHQWNFPLMTYSCCSWFPWVDTALRFSLISPLTLFLDSLSGLLSSNLSHHELLALWRSVLGPLLFSHFAPSLKGLSVPVVSTIPLPLLGGDPYTSPLSCGPLTCYPTGISTGCLKGTANSKCPGFPLQTRTRFSSTICSDSDESRT